MTRYNSGADFERKVARKLEAFGFITVRSAGSRSPADIVAIKAGIAFAVQCKTNGRLDPDEWNTFFGWCEKGGITPILAWKAKTTSGITYARLTGRKSGRGRQPLAEWEPLRDWEV